MSKRLTMLADIAQSCELINKKCEKEVQFYDDAVRAMKKEGKEPNLHDVKYLKLLSIVGFLNAAFLDLTNVELEESNEYSTEVVEGDSTVGEDEEFGGAESGEAGEGTEERS